MKTNTIKCPHCGHLRVAEFNSDGEFYAFERDGKCGECGQWHDAPVVEVQDE